MAALDRLHRRLWDRLVVTVAVIAVAPVLLVLLAQALPAAGVLLGFWLAGRWLLRRR